jgi:undecaprenyl-diphosphatase
MILVFGAALVLLFFVFPVAGIAGLLAVIDRLPSWAAAVEPRIRPTLVRLSLRPFVVALRRHGGRALDFVLGRFDPRKAWGLSVTLAIAAALVGAGLFLGVLEELLALDPLVTVDLRLHNSLVLVRSARLTAFFIAVTQTAAARVVAPLAVAVAAAALMREHIRTAAGVLVSVSGAAVLSVTLKALVHHPRPIDPLLGAREASFPSGHTLTAAAFYGFLAFLLVRSHRKGLLRPVAVFLLLAWIVLVALSRIYLGMHWPSDVLGSLAIGLAWLSLIAGAHAFRSPIPFVDTLSLTSRRWARLAAAGLPVVAAAALWSGVRNARELSPPSGPAPRAIAPAVLARRPPRSLLGRSEDLAGGVMEPVSLIVIARDADLVGAFERSGWSVAERPTPPKVLRELAAALRGEPDPRAPATPAYYEDRPPTLTFEKPDTPSASIRSRHHARFWKTNLCAAPGCVPVWVATASHDVGVWRIDANIDEERALVRAGLLAAGAEPLATLTEYPALKGVNAAGDRFFTDGHVEVLSVARNLLERPPK